MIRRKFPINSYQLLSSYQMPGLFWSHIKVLPTYLFLLTLAISMKPVDASPLIDLYKTCDLKYIIDSLSGQNDEEILIKVRAALAVGDKKLAFRLLSQLDGSYLQAAVLYYLYGDYKKAAEISSSHLTDSGFSAWLAIYLKAISLGALDADNYEMWRKLAASPVEVFSSKANLKLAGSYFKKGHQDSAMSYLNVVNLVSLSKKDKIYCYNLKVKILCRAKNYQEAFKQLRKALKIEYLYDEKQKVITFTTDLLYPHLDEQDALLLLNIFRKNRYYDEVIRLLQDSSIDDSTRMILAWSYFGKKRYSIALKIFKELSASKDRDLEAEALYGLAICDYRRGQRVKAVDKLLEFTQDFPDSPLASKALFIAGDFYHKSDPGKSIEIFGQLISRYPYSKYYPRALFLLGHLFAKLGQRQKALELFSSYDEDDELADLFDFWVYKIALDGSAGLNRIISRKKPTFYHLKAREILGLFEKGPISTFNVFIEAFFNRAERFLLRHTEKIQVENRLMAYIDSLYFYSLESEAGRQTLYIHNRYHDLHTDLILLKKCRELALDMVFFKILEDFKTSLQKSGLSFSHDSWLRLNYPVLFEKRLSYLADDIDPYLALAVIRRESRFEPDAVSRAGALGLMQLLPSTASQMAKVKEIDPETLFDPGYNIKLGCRYIRWLDVRMHRDEVVIAAYNAGPTATRRWEKLAGNDIETFIEIIDYDQSRNYTRWVMGDYLWYKRLWPDLFGDNSKVDEK